MPEIVYNVFVYLLAVYGAIALVISIVESISKSARESIPGMRLVLEVKNQEEYIEGVLKNLFSSSMLGKTIPVDSITVLDMGSTDNTLKILKLLGKDYECLEVLEEKDKEKIFEGLDEGCFPSPAK